MKRCPECNRVESDDALTFCRIDGTPLVRESGAVNADAGTVKFGSAPAAPEIETSILPHRTDVEMSRSTAPTTVLPAPSTPGTTHDLSRPKRRGFVIALFALLIAAVCIAGYFVFSRRNRAIQSLAVLPFVNESGNEDVEYLSDGMTEMLISSLTKVPNLSVKARSSVFYYKGKQVSPKKVGEELGVEAVLLGRITLRGDELKLSLELVDTSTLDALWSETYERERSDLVALQSEVARDVSGKIRAKLTGEEEQKVSETGTVDPNAYQAYLRGRFYWNKRGEWNQRAAANEKSPIERSIEELKAAIEIDPKYAPAYAAIAECYAWLSPFVGERSAETRPLARYYAERAIVLNGKLAAPHTALGAVEMQTWHWQLAEEHFKKAIELEPNYPTGYQWYSGFLRAVGKIDKAAEMTNRARELDPLSSIVGLYFSELLQIQGKWQESIDNSLKVIELTPNFVPVYYALGFSYLKTGQFDKSIAAFEKGTSLGKDPYGVACLGYAYAKTGKRAEATRILESLKKEYEAGQSSGYDIAILHVGLGDEDGAFDWLEKSFEAREDDLFGIKWDIPVQPLANDPRFSNLLRRMGLPE